MYVVVTTERGVVVEYGAAKRVLFESGDVEVEWTSGDKSRFSVWDVRVYGSEADAIADGARNGLVA